MTKIKLIFSLLIILITANLSLAVGQNVPSFLMYNGDTINKIDINNKKQGSWIIFGKMKKSLPNYQPEQIIEKGNYVNSRKFGIWIKFFPSEKPMSEITYKNNRPNGAYKIYYENGVLQEQGVWKNNRNIKSFLRNHENGEKQQEFKFNKSGKRDGVQKYYHENGKIMIEGNWNGGKENGEIKEYYANGELKSIKVFNDGGIDVEKTQKFEAKKPIIQPVAPPKEVKVAEKVDVKKERANVRIFNGEGDWTLYNKNKQISQKGFFKGGRLMNGKKYKYNADGILESIEIYKAGRYKGEGVIEENKQ